MPHTKPEKLSKISFDDCVFDESSNCFVSHIGKISGKKRVKYTGLLPVLRKTFYDNFDKGKMKKDKTMYKRKSKKKSGKKKSYLGNLVGSISRGKIVHDQLRILNNPDLKDTCKEEYTKMDPFTTKIRKWMKANNWVSLAEELPICDTFIGVATAIDSIIYNPTTKELAIAEWKTGSLEYFYSFTRKMKNMDSIPIRQVPNNSLYNQAQFQTVMSHYILNKNYLKKANLSIDKLIIVHANDEGVREHIIGTDFISLGDYIYRKIAKDRL